MATDNRGGVIELALEAELASDGRCVGLDIESAPVEVGETQ
jgi:hypothetical protein